MRYTFKQYCSIEKGTDAYYNMTVWFDAIFGEMELINKTLYCLSGNRWVFQKVGKKMYYSYPFIAKVLMEEYGYKTFQISEIVDTQLQVRNFKYDTLECKVIPEFKGL